MTTIQTVILIFFVVFLLFPICFRLYRKLVVAFTWPTDKDFVDAQEYAFGRDYPEGW